MNEDDTFDALRRTPLEKLQKLMLEDERGAFESAVYHPFDNYELAFLERHGWTPVEFRRAWKDQALQENPNIVNSSWWPNFLGLLE